MLNHLLTTNELKVEEVYQILTDAQSFADGMIWRPEQPNVCCQLVF